MEDILATKSATAISLLQTLKDNQAHDIKMMAPEKNGEGTTAEAQTETKKERERERHTDTHHDTDLDTDSHLNSIIQKYSRTQRPSSSAASSQQVLDVSLGRYCQHQATPHLRHVI